MNGLCLIKGVGIMVWGRLAMIEVRQRRGHGEVCG